MPDVIVNVELGEVAVSVPLAEVHADFVLTERVVVAAEGALQISVDLAPVTVAAQVGGPAGPSGLSNLFIQEDTPPESDDWQLWIRPVRLVNGKTSFGIIAREP